MVIEVNLPAQFAEIQPTQTLLGLSMSKAIGILPNNQPKETLIIQCISTETATIQEISLRALQKLLLG
jgi:sialic acid synthase SpsE